MGIHFRQFNFDAPKQPKCFTCKDDPLITFLVHNFAIAISSQGSVFVSLHVTVAGQNYELKVTFSGTFVADEPDLRRKIRIPSERASWNSSLDSAKLVSPRSAPNLAFSSEKNLASAAPFSPSRKFWGAAGGRRANCVLCFVLDGTLVFGSEDGAVDCVVAPIKVRWCRGTMQGEVQMINWRLWYV